MTISSVCHSQGSPCASRIPLGPKAGPVPIPPLPPPPSSAIFSHVTEAARVVLHAAIIHLVLPLPSKSHETCMTLEFPHDAFQGKFCSEGLHV